jgi:quercetin dioxygenase-like cupin family protein
MVVSGEVNSGESQKPYSDRRDNLHKNPDENPDENPDGIIRTFSPDVDAEELIWHRDREAREIEILQAAGWGFQREDTLPQSLQNGERIQIPKGEWHRAIRGQGELIIRITKFRAGF